MDVRKKRKNGKGKTVRTRDGGWDSTKFGGGIDASGCNDADAEHTP